MSEHEHVFDSQLLCKVCGNCALDLQEAAEARAALESIERNEPNGIAIVARALAAETGRSDSGRPPAAVASADPELAKLLREAVERWASHDDGCPHEDLISERCRCGVSEWRGRARSALSRLAGQAATAEIAKDSGGAARGLAEEER